MGQAHLTALRQLDLLHGRYKMRASELFERVLKHEGEFKIWENPTASAIREIIKNNWIATNVPEFDPEEEDEIDYLRGSVHGLDYPLRGLIANGTVYIVDSYYADHDTLASTLTNQGIIGDPQFDYSTENIIELIPLVIEKHKKGKMSGRRDDPNDYMIGVPPKYVSIVKNIPTVEMMKLPIEQWS